MSDASERYRAAWSGGRNAAFARRNARRRATMSVVSTTFTPSESEK